jgi:3-hydroxybutyryl-CoA dehydrogenase
MIDPNDKDFTVGIVGAGAMGQGIVQVALAGGMNVILLDVREGAAEAGISNVFKRLNRLVEKGKLEEKQVAEMRGRAIAASGLGEFSACHLVIEAVFEDIDLKQRVFGEIEEAVSDDCIIATNTSSILISSIARASHNRGRIAGMHFFNPVPLMRLVEVIRCPETRDDVVDFLVEVGKRMGRTPVVAKDAPGFIVNFGGRSYTTEAMRILHERIATPAQIDAIMRDCCGFRMGPCELMDLTGVDVNFPVTQIIYLGYDDDPRLKTSFPHRLLLESGQLGRKAGRGNFTYNDKGEMIDPPSPDHVTDAAPAKSVVLCEADEALEKFAAELDLAVLKDDDGKSPLLAAPLGEDCSAFAIRTGADFRRLVAVDLSTDISKRVTVMTAPGADEGARDAIAAAIAASGRAVTAIKDSPGFVAQRIRAMIANLGCEMAQIGVAAPDQIDLALKLGLNYPQGPLEMADLMGPGNVLALLNRMQELTGEDRYRPSTWLRRRAGLGLPISTPD